MFELEVVGLGKLGRIPITPEVVDKQRQKKTNDRNEDQENGKQDKHDHTYNLHHFDRHCN